MIVGLEGRHSCGLMTLNNLTTWPRFKLEGIPGLRSLPDFDPIQDAATGRIGEVPRLGERRGKSITYEGVLQALTLLSFREMSALMPSHLASTDELKWIAAPHPSDPNKTVLPTRFFHARTVEATVSETWHEHMRTKERGFIAPFSVVLRLSDPRYYHGDEKVYQSSTLATTTAWGIPITPDGETDSPSDQMVSLDVANDGNYHTESLITVSVNSGASDPIINPVVVNNTDGVFIRFRELTLDPGEGITIDSRRRRVVRFNGNNQRHKIDPTSTWWDRGVPNLKPGTSKIILRAWKQSDVPILRVEFNSADIV
jgi:hypothetical protein